MMSASIEEAYSGGWRLFIVVVVVVILLVTMVAAGVIVFPVSRELS